MTRRTGCAAIASLAERALMKPARTLEAESGRPRYWKDPALPQKERRRLARMGGEPGTSGPENVSSCVSNGNGSCRTGLNGSGQWALVERLYRPKMKPSERPNCDWQVKRFVGLSPIASTKSHYAKP
jgi:hypothetical protein